MKLFLAGGESRPGIHEKALQKWGKEYKPYILESFYNVREAGKKYLPVYGDYLLDSGAFTFMRGGNANWDEYIERYAAHIKENNIEKFFELDIDSVAGYEKVLEYRKNLERLTGRQCIPVWHKSRGPEEFKKMCSEYNYVAIGGLVTKEIPLSQYGILPVLIDEAHKLDAKVHGLGFTRLGWLDRIHFDSVDSTAWMAGNRSGAIYKFNGRTMDRYRPNGKRLADSRKAAFNNYVEWLKFQKWAEHNL